MFWLAIKPRVFGTTDADWVGDTWKQRVEFLSDEEKTEMEELVRRKVEEKEHRVLVLDESQ